ncbi:BA14K-like protein [Rhizobium sp. PP-F2F-G38]|uniref:Lectin-like protein BA14k n=1 Tax=Ferranicluibacter rubi TaxID=2715133 RepID=A0AA43ZC36_9HYPH|nr:BA14K family protein [Ferranicluibacter rubi]NHT75099.1 BA14K family protein [Ferranicluibacter rubi]PYE35740.1 BA14K-like protein [Rhizobium sp. PP-WC-1G-195]PYE99234.1 BA14K-like protein [Rhizobium sp. PP-F2F-G38]TCP87266.1 BA14K-like protein [Rhizobium sp. PP-CC-2G-626]
MKKLIIAFVSLVTAFSGIGPVSAMPLAKIEPVQTRTDVQQVRDRVIIRRHNGRGNWNRDRGHWRGNRGDWRGDRAFRTLNGHRDWRGNRGYRYDRRYRDRYYRDGYYRDRGVGLALGGLAAGAIIGGALNSQPRYVRPGYTRAYGGNSHVAWCQARYRSYRAYDNSYQPYNGPRRLCNSPY